MVVKGWVQSLWCTKGRGRSPVCLSALEYVISTAQHAAQGLVAGDIENITSYDILHFSCRYCTHICYLIITDLFAIVNLRTCEVAIKYWGHIFFSCSWILLLLAWVGYVTMIVSFDALRVCSWICQWANVGGGGLWFTYRGHKRNSFFLFVF